MRIALVSDIHGDRRSAYLLLDEGKPAIRRVEYDMDRELKALSNCGLLMPIGLQRSS